MISKSIDEISTYIECPYRWLYKWHYGLEDKPVSPVITYLDALKISVMKILSMMHAGYDITKDTCMGVWSQNWFEGPPASSVPESELWNLGMCGSLAVLGLIDEFSGRNGLVVGGTCVPAYIDVERNNERYRFFGAIDAILYRKGREKEIYLHHLSEDIKYPTAKIMRNNTKVMMSTMIFLGKKHIIPDGVNAKAFFVYTHLRTCRSEKVKIPVSYNRFIIDTLVNISRSIIGKRLYLRSDFDRCGTCYYMKICNIRHGIKAEGTRGYGSMKEHLQERLSR